MVCSDCDRRGPTPLRSEFPSQGAELVFNLIKASNDGDLRMLSGKNSKVVEETKTIFVPIRAQFSDPCTKTGGMKHERRKGGSNASAA